MKNGFSVSYIFYNHRGVTVIFLFFKNVLLQIISVYVRIIIGSCEPNPCLNGGSCLESPEIGFSCLCQQIQKGKFCENGQAGKLVKFISSVLPAIFKNEMFSWTQ